MLQVIRDRYATACARVENAKRFKPVSSRYHAQEVARRDELESLLREIDGNVTKRLEDADEDTLRIARMFAPRGNLP